MGGEATQKMFPIHSSLVSIKCDLYNNFIFYMKKCYKEYMQKVGLQISNSFSGISYIDEDVSVVIVRFSASI